MVQVNGTSGSGGSKFNIPAATVLTLLFVGATFVGQWYVANERSMKQEETIEKLEDRLSSLSTDVFAMRLEVARTGQRLDNVVERVNEMLRRERSTAFPQ